MYRDRPSPTISTNKVPMTKIPPLWQCRDRIAQRSLATCELHTHPIKLPHPLPVLLQNVTTMKLGVPTKLCHWLPFLTKQSLLSPWLPLICHLPLSCLPILKISGSYLHTIYPVPSWGTLLRLTCFSGILLSSQVLPCWDSQSCPPALTHLQLWTHFNADPEVVVKMK